MFSTEELKRCMDEQWFVDCYNAVEQALIYGRLGRSAAPLDAGQAPPLVRFTQAVLASAPNWMKEDSHDAHELCSKAADIEAGLANIRALHGRSVEAHMHSLRSTLLYELAEMPGTAASVAKKNGTPLDLLNYFSRDPEAEWGLLGGVSDASRRDGIRSDEEERDSNDTGTGPRDSLLIEEALGEVLSEGGSRLQAEQDTQSVHQLLRQVSNALSSYSLAWTSDEASALEASFGRRERSSTLRFVTEYTDISKPQAHRLKLPSQLWPVQQQALKDGLLKQGRQSYGLAAPTGTGKTALMRLLIANFKERNPDRKALYISPSRSLVSEVYQDLAKAFKSFDIQVKALGSHLTAHEVLDGDAAEHDVLIFTPERADLLMRVNPDFMDRTGLVIVDEAHHIESGSRGILLEFYLWRLRQLLPTDARVVQLSAVAPNVEELVEWVNHDGEPSHTLLDWRASRLRMGIFQRHKDGAGVVKFDDERPFTLFGPGEFSADKDEGITDLAEHLAGHGTVLLLTTSPERAETLANLIAAKREAVTAPAGRDPERLDAWAEREMFADVSLRGNFRKGVVYHHSQLPPRVRHAVERVVTERYASVVCATTTLKEGVNFPFSTVLVETLVSQAFEMTPRDLWNIAGRAGRFGVDSEGHCILFRPEKWEHRLRRYRLKDYLGTRMDSIPPVKSALADGMETLFTAIDNGDIAADAIDNVELKDMEVDGERKRERKEAIRALVNLVRVGYTHAHVSGLRSDMLEDSSEVETEFLMSRQIAPEALPRARTTVQGQKRIIQQQISRDPEFVRIAARIGWSLEVQESIYFWLHNLEDWQLQSFGNLVLGGHLRSAEGLSYLIGPLAKKMADFSGGQLGGKAGYVAEHWIKGRPINQVFDKVKGRGGLAKFGNVIHFIFGKMQYMLPWSLFGCHELLEYECRLRGINLNDGVKDLSVLASEGVPNFEALRLVTELDVERVDATRLSAAYMRSAAETDVIGWFHGTQWDTVAGIVRGRESRRIDPDLREIWMGLQDG